MKNTELVGKTTPDGHCFLNLQRVNASGNAVYEIRMPWCAVQTWVVNDETAKLITDWIDGGPRPVGKLSIR